MHYDGPMLTDSGGFQVFSLADTVKISDDGVTFKSIYDGAKIHWTPEENMAIQQKIGADIAMQLDQCAPYPRRVSSCRRRLTTQARGRVVASPRIRARTRRCSASYRAACSSTCAWSRCAA